MPMQKKPKDISAVTRCETCGNKLSKHRFIWPLDGEKVVCSRCYTIFIDGFFMKPRSDKDGEQKPYTRNGS